MREGRHSPVGGSGSVLGAGMTQDNEDADWGDRLKLARLPTTQSQDV